MTRLRTPWKTFLDRQHRYPTGLAGRLIGEQMVRQHTPETLWTIDTLDIQLADQVLELGFGAGYGLAVAARRADRGLVTGIDLSATMLHAASRRNRAALRSGRLALLRGSISDLPLAGRRFDKIFSIHTFYFWPEPMRICAELLAMLNPGGTLAVTLATGQVAPSGELRYWPLHQHVEALIQALRQLKITSAELLHGPNSRQYNNVAIIARA